MSKKIIYNLLSITSFGIFIWSAIKGKSDVLTYTFFLTLAFAVLANLDKIKKFKASSSGLELEAHEIIKKAEVTINELHKLAKLVAQTTLSLVKRSSRYGGYPEGEQEMIKSNALNLISQLGINEQEQKDLLKEWDEYTEIDYVLLILGSQIPSTWPKEEHQKWKEMRKDLKANRPTPKQIKELLEKNNAFSKLHEEAIRDYEYYLQKKKHRRPEIWLNQRELGKQFNL